MSTDEKYVVDVMTSNPVVVAPETITWTAECLAQKKSVHDLLVVRGYRLVGVVCRCDLQVAGTAARVQDCMRTNPVTIDDQQTVDAAERLMDRCSVGCLPVVDWSGWLRGVLTLRDLLNAGVLRRGLRTCASCGSSHALPSPNGDDEVLFCARCLEDGRQPRNSLDEAYFTTGGGD
jgi:CBS domain-containing protein